MIRLILMRHGNTFEKGQIPVQVGARTDLPLTDFGKEQAKQMGKYLYDAGLIPSAIFSGKLKRQLESAQIVGDCFGLPIFQTPSLTEIDYGLWEGLSADAIASRWPEEYREWTENRTWPKAIFGSSFETHQQAIHQFLELLRKTCQGIVFAVASQGVLRFFKNEKVKTGSFCELLLFKDCLKLESWNTRPFHEAARLGIGLVHY